MLFNSYIFIFLFLPVALIGYYLLNKLNKSEISIVFLTVMSFIFYGYVNPFYLIFLIAGIIINYFLIHMMSRHLNHKKMLMIIGVILNVAVLGYFKYTNFFIANINAILNKDIVFLNIALPLGISFYTFQQIAYLVDYYRGECEKYTLLEYANLITFFPHLISGPIVYHSELIPQFRDSNNRKFNADNFTKGLYAFAIGLGKKVMIADYLSKVVDAGYSDISSLNSISAIITVLCYAFQIYFDFSGYCDMAYGIAYMFNIELPINFNSPLKSVNTGEFWNRWHITLNRFFTKYLYIPMGGSRKGTLRTYLNTMIVFMISGLWHGPDYSFVIWGAIYGVAVCINRNFKKVLDKIPKAFGIALNFLLFVFTFIFFRADSVTDAFTMIGCIVRGGAGRILPILTEAFNSVIEIKFLYRLGMGGILNAFPAAILLVYLLVIFIIVFACDNTFQKALKMKHNVSEIVFTVTILIISILSLSDITTFVYFNF